MWSSSRFTVGQWVEVRSKEEILASLDQTGRLDGLPFMPEMFQFCGKRLQVFKRAHKTCDPPNGLESRRMPGAVHLDRVRCDGAAHGGCQAGCLIFWKDAWLKPLEENTGASPLRSHEDSVQAWETPARCTKDHVWRATRKSEECLDASEPTYVCQSTEIPAATHVLRWWDVRQYFEDYTSGNVSLSRMAASVFAFLIETLASAGVGLGSFARWMFKGFHAFAGSTPYPWGLGRIPAGTRTPSLRSDLQPGEWVRVRSHDEILNTVDETGHNRGLWFDAEMVPYCGSTQRVLERVSRIINEKTGRMQVFPNPCIVLDSVVCEGRYSKCRRFCPRSIYPYWREIWLERTTPPIFSVAGRREGD